MLKFKSVKECVKCGDVFKHEPIRRYRSSILDNPNSSIKELHEWFDVWCPNCEYKWQESIKENA